MSFILFDANTKDAYGALGWHHHGPIQSRMMASLTLHRGRAIRANPKLDAVSTSVADAPSSNDMSCGGGKQSFHQATPARVNCGVSTRTRFASHALPRCDLCCQWTGIPVIHIISDPT